MAPMASRYLALSFCLLAASSATAHASPPTPADAPLVASGEPSTIIGGDEVPGCGWPNVVKLAREDGGFFCSGTLIHPSIVATAGHCALSPSGGPAFALFGDGAADPALVREIDFCMAHPDFVYAPSGIPYNNLDLAFCQLSEPVENLPIIPLAYGCDYTELQGITPVDVVGFGLDENDEIGVKRALEVNTVLFEASGEIQLTPGTCSGDSGGGVFRVAADGTKRQVGIISHRLVPEGVSLACGTPGTVSVATAAWQIAPLVEANTEFDVTPCHDIDGNWEPSLECQGVPLDPGAGDAGDYAQGCVELERSGFLDSCGPPLAVDETAPNVELVSPTDGDQFSDLTDGTHGVEFVVEADDGDGSGIALVSLSVDSADGETVTEVRAEPPYTWTVELAQGSYEVSALAEDHAGLTTQTEPVSIDVGAPMEPSTGGDSGDDETTGRSTDTDASSTGAGADDSEGGGCRVHPTNPAPAGLLLMLLFWMRRRGTLE